MLLAAFGDVAGNGPALCAVLDALEAEGIQTLINTGDSVGRGSAPVAVLDALRRRGVVSAQGELDRQVGRCVRKQATAKVAGSVAETYHALRSDQVEYLLGLPKRHRITVDGIAIYLCADSPQETDPESRFARIREEANANLLICGHAAIPFARWVGDSLFVNPGSVSAEAGIAHYVVVDTETTPWQATPHRLEYGKAGS